MTFRTAAILLSITVSTAGCTTGSSFKSDCDWVQLIQLSRSNVLTRQTKQQILAHNEAGATLFGWPR
jgi:hypothetical protein